MIYIVSSIIVICSIIMMVSLYFEKYWIPSVVPIACIVAAHHWDVINIISLFKQNVLEFCLYFAGYIALGIVWSYIKWASVLFHFKSFRQDIIDRYNNTDDFKLPRSQINTFYSESQKRAYEQNEKQSEKLTLKEVLGKKSFYFDDHAFYASDRPSASRCKSNIIGWICFWPFSLIVTLLTDPVRKIVTFIFNRISKSYQKLADKIVQPINFENK